MAKQWKQSLTSSDVQAEAEDALEKDINNLSPASNSIADNLDGGVAAVDWSSKAVKYADGATISDNDNLVSVSGSGYIMTLWIKADGTNTNTFDFTIDSTSIFSGVNTNGQGFTSDEQFLALQGPMRFESSFNLSTNTAEDSCDGVVIYVLD